MAKAKDGHEFVVVTHYKDGGPPNFRLFALEQNAYAFAESESDTITEKGCVSSVEIWSVPIEDNIVNYEKGIDKELLAWYERPAHEYDDHNQIMEQFDTTPRAVRDGNW